MKDEHRGSFLSEEEWKSRRASKEQPKLHVAADVDLFDFADEEGVTTTAMGPGLDQKPFVSQVHRFLGDDYKHEPPNPEGLPFLSYETWGRRNCHCGACS